MAKQSKIRLSVLDLSPVATGSSGREALQNTLDLARLADGLGYTRYWMAEHHNTIGIASSVPEIMIGHVADVTTRMRVGSGGIMLPNHSSLHVAESFRVLESLHPGRIDLGIGRAPGTDMLTAQALRRSADARDTFPSQMAELLDLFEGKGLEGEDLLPGSWPCLRMPPRPSSGCSAPAATAPRPRPSSAWAWPSPTTSTRTRPVGSMRLYQEGFQPSAYFSKPQSILTVAALCAPTREEAEDLASSFDLVRSRY